MGKTVPSYRIALENEICNWNKFEKTLSSEDREAFEQLMDACMELCVCWKQRR